MERRALRMAELATGNRDDALELVQDAMMALVKSYRDRDEEQWKRLFYRILQRRIRDWYRRNRVRHRFRLWLGGARSADAGDDEAADPLQNLADPGQAGIVECVQQQVAVSHLESALRDLPERQRQVFLLRAWEGLGVADTAFAMGCSAGSVKTHYSRAIHRLREMLEDHWP